MSETTQTAAGAAASAAIAATARKRGGPNRMIIVWGRPNAGKSTFAFTLATDAADPRFRWLGHVDGDDSGASLAGAYDPAIARHYPVLLDSQDFIRALRELEAPVAAGECGAVVVEGLCPLYDHYVGISFGDNPEEAEAGGTETMRLYTAPAGKIRAVHSAITRLYQAAPRDSGFVMVITMHAKNVGGVGKTPVWAPDVSAGVWEEFWRMTPIVLELARLDGQAPQIEWADPKNETRRIKNIAARNAAEAARAKGQPLATLPQFLDTIAGAERWQAREQRKREVAAKAKVAPPPAEAPTAPLQAAEASTGPGA